MNNGPDHKPDDDCYDERQLDDRLSAEIEPTRIDRSGRRPARGRPRWSLEMFEPTLMDGGVSYKVHDACKEGTVDASLGWIEFWLSTRLYRNTAGGSEVLVRLSVADGCLGITAPGLYPRGSLNRTTTPPPDRDGNLRVLRLGDDDCTQMDLFIMADETITAVLRLETLQRLFNRADILKLAEEFAAGIDLLEFVVQMSGLRRS
jgi:hypothetical protein